MCVDKQISVSCDNKIVAGNMAFPKKTKFAATYSIKKVLRSLFTKQNVHKRSVRLTLTTSLESLDNIRNSQFEDHYEEIVDNAANEKLMSCIYDSDSVSRSSSFERITDLPSYYSHSNRQHDDEEVLEDDKPEIFVPVRFARTDAGTFFWTTNLQPIAATDDDLIQPLYCSTANQRPQLQFQDRWAQA